MAAKQIEITNFIRKNEHGVYIDYIEGCFIKNKSKSFLIGLNSKSTAANNKLSRITEVHLQDFTKPFKKPNKIWSSFYGSSEPKDELFYELYWLLMDEIGDEILELEKIYPPIEPYIPQRAKKVYEKLLSMGAWVWLDKGYGDHTAFVLHWRNDDTYEIFAKYGDQVREEDGTLNGQKIIGHGLREDVHKLFEKNDLYWEWHDAGLIQVYKNYFSQGAIRNAIKEV
tara:strand:+ start:693264 stop:693941 length:678 start_codon:yes stop_codon:yes gene_type:complete